ncbi:MAG: flotillin-like FloA family protein, partial [Clostridia bacterium]
MSNPADVGSLIWIIVALVVAVLFVVVILRFVPFGLWITSLAAGVRVSIGSLIGMRLRRIQPKRLVEPLIKARKAGLDVTLSKLETHFLAGGNVDRVINALIAAQRSNIEMPFEKASAI